MRFGLRAWGAAVAASLVLAATFAFGASALEVPPVPTDIPVVDQTSTLSDQQRNELAGMIADSRAKTGNQIAVLIIPTLADEALEDYSLQVARKWGVGQKDRSSGVLLLVVKNDRKVRIEVGYGLEGALTDLRSGRIIRERMTPEFREGKYYEGIRSGVEGVVLAIGNEVDPNLSSNTDEPSGSVPWEFVIGVGFMVVSWLGAMLARTKSWWLGGVLGAIAGVIIGLIFGFVVVGIVAIGALTIGGLLLDFVVSKNYRERASHGDAPSWWAGGPYIGGGGNGGGFGGFGGGGFGGGGASGDW